MSEADELDGGRSRWPFALPGAPEWLWCWSWLWLWLWLWLALRRLIINKWETCRVHKSVVWPNSTLNAIPLSRRHDSARSAAPHRNTKSCLCPSPRPRPRPRPHPRPRPRDPASLPACPPAALRLPHAAFHLVRSGGFGRSGLPTAATSRPATAPSLPQLHHGQHSPGPTVNEPRVSLVIPSFLSFAVLSIKSRHGSEVPNRKRPPGRSAPRRA